MITKHTCRKILLCSASTFLAGAMAVAQAPPGSSMPQQQQPQTPEQSRTAPIGATDTTNDNRQQISDQAFVSKALQGGNAEVQLGQLAQQKAQSSDVKDFGQKMVQDHTQLGEQMKPIAQQLGVKEPKELSKKDRQLMAKLQGLSGQQFDEAYIQAMVKDHKQDLKEFKQAADMTQNPNLKQVAQQGAQVISQHLEMIQQIAQSHNVSTEGKTKASSAQ
jgi:putative membrane protein